MVYNTQDIAMRIKRIIKSHKYKIKDMFNDLNLGSNLLSQLYHGQNVSFISIAKVADYLDCSVDYLLGRTDDPDAHKMPDQTDGDAG